MLGMILIIFLILALVGAFPRWGHSREWGYIKEMIKKNNK